jgi:dienelactone hydrolase
VKDLQPPVDSDRATSTTAWHLSLDTPLGPQVTLLVLQQSGSLAIGYVERWDGWVPVDDLVVAPDQIRFAAETAVFPLQFDLRVGGDRLTGTAEDLPSSSGMPGLIGRVPVTGRTVPVPEVQPVDEEEDLAEQMAAYFATIREAAPLPGYTLYRPVGDGPWPVVVWGNGGARASNEEFLTFLTQLAAHGFLVIAAGNPWVRFEPPLGDRQPDVLREALDWIHSDPPELAALGGDITRVAVMGQSAGASQAWAVANHPVVRSLAVWNGATEAVRHARAVAQGVSVPTLIVTGGTTDIAYAAMADDWNAMDPAVPAIWADHSEAGHIGLFHGTNDPAAVQRGAAILGQEVEVQASRLAVYWLRATLDHDSSATERLNQADGYPSKLRHWTVQRRALGSNKPSADLADSESTTG